MQEKKIFIIHSLFFFSMLIYFYLFHIIIIYFTLLSYLLTLNPSLRLTATSSWFLCKYLSSTSVLDKLHQWPTNDTVWIRISSNKIEWAEPEETCNRSMARISSKHFRYFPTFWQLHILLKLGRYLTK